METSNNIVEFPRSKIVRDGVLDTDELKKMKAKSLQNFADSLIQELTENILMDLDNCGVDIESDAFIKDFHYLVTTLSATIYRTLDLPHPLHKFLDEHVKIVSDEDDLNEEQLDMTDL